MIGPIEIAKLLESVERAFIEVMNLSCKWVPSNPPGIAKMNAGELLLLFAVPESVERLGNRRARKLEEVTDIERQLEALKCGVYSRSPPNQKPNKG